MHTSKLFQILNYIQTYILSKKLRKHKKGANLILSKGKKTAWKIKDSKYFLFFDNERVELHEEKSSKKSDQSGSVSFQK